MNKIQNNVIYIKGFNQDNSNNSNTFNELKTIVNIDTELHLFTPDYRSIDSFNSNFNEIIDLIQIKNNVTIIGNSFGGFLAMYIVAKTNVKSILINPQINPQNTKQLISDETKEYYNEIQNQILNSLDPFKYLYKLVLLGLDDKVIPIQHFLNSEYLKYTEKTIIDRYEGHKFQNILKYKRGILEVISH